MPKLDEYLRISDAAQFLGVCANTLRNWEKSGVLPARRHPANGYRLYLIKDLEKFLDGIDGGPASSKSSSLHTSRKKKPR